MKFKSLCQVHFCGYVFLKNVYQSRHFFHKISAAFSIAPSRAKDLQQFWLALSTAFLREQFGPLVVSLVVILSKPLLRGEGIWAIRAMRRWFLRRNDRAFGSLPFQN
jgi:hypothetical protein